MTRKNTRGMYYVASPLYTILMTLYNHICLAKEADCNLGPDHRLQLYYSFIFLYLEQVNNVT